MDPLPNEQTPLHDLPHFEKEVLNLISNGRNDLTSQGSQPTLVATWYVDQQRYPIQQPRRDVSLPPQPQQWRRSILQAWNDIAIEGQAAYFFLVKPQPSRDGEIHLPHILVIQSPSPNMASTLIHIKVIDEGYSTDFIRAATLTQIANHEMIYHVAQLGHHCTIFQPTTVCMITSGEFEHADNHYIVVEDGRVLTITVHNNVDANSALFHGINPEAEDGVADDQSLLQTRASTTTRECPKQIAISDFLSQGAGPIYGTPLWSVLEYIDSVLLPFRFDFPWTDYWPSLHEWCQHWWDFRSTFSQLQIYYDGSFFSELENAGVGIAAFVLTDHGWEFAGALAAKCPQGAFSYEAELWAGITASELAMDLLRFGQVCGNQHVDLHLCFDALTIGHQADGSWSSFSKPELGSLLRSLTRLITARFDVDISQWHVRGHRGEVGNEFADELAKRGAMEEIITDLQNWFDCAATVDLDAF